MKICRFLVQHNCLLTFEWVRIKCYTWLNKASNAYFPKFAPKRWKIEACRAGVWYFMFNALFTLKHLLKHLLQYRKFRPLKTPGLNRPNFLTNVVSNSNRLGIKRFVSEISISFKCKYNIIIQIQCTKNLLLTLIILIKNELKTAIVHQLEPCLPQQDLARPATRPYWRLVCLRR